MSRRGYIRFLAAGAAGLLLAAALLALARVPASEQILSFATEALREDLGHAVTIDKASVSLFPPRLDFQGVTVPDSEGRPLMTIQRVRGYLNPLKLLWDTLALRRLRLDGVDLLVEIDPHERLNLSPLLDAVRLALERHPRGIEIQIREILLVDSRVRYVDRHRGIEAEGNGVLFDLKLPRSTGGTYRGRLVVDEIRKKSGVRSQKSGEGEHGRLEIEGKVRGGESPVVDLRGRLHLDAGLVAPLLGTQGSGKGDLRFALKGEYPALEADGDLALAKVSLAGMALTEGSAKVRFKENTLRLTGAALRLYGGELRGEGSIEFQIANFKSQIGKYFLRAQYKGIGLKPLIPGGMTSPDLPPGTISGEIALEGSGVRTASMQGKGTMQYRGPDDRGLEGLSRTGRHFARFAAGEAAWVLRDSEVVMERAVFESPDSTLSLGGAVRLPQGLGLEVRLESRRLGEPFILLDFPDATGRLTLQGALRGTIEEPRLEGRIQIQEARVRDVPFQRAEGGIVWVPGRVTLTAMHLEQGESTYRLEGEFPVGQSKVPGRATLEARQGDPGMVIRLFTRPLPVRMQLDGKMAFQGTPDRFSWEGVLRGRGQVYGQQYDQARAKVRVTDREVVFDQLTALAGTGIVQGKGQIGYDGSFRGHLSAQGVDLRQVDYLREWGVPFEGKGTLRLEGEGQFAAPVLKGSVAIPQVTYRGTAMGRAEGEVETQGGILHGRIRLFDRQAEVRAAYDPARSHRWELGLDLRQGRLDPFLHLWRLERLTKAAITTTGSLQMRGEGWDLDRMELSARFPQFNLEIGGYQAQGDGAIAVEMRNRLLRILSMRFKGEGTSLAVTGTARAGEQVQIQLDGKANLQLLKFLTDELEVSSGESRLQIRVSDRWDAPYVSGALTVEKGALKLRDLPQRLDQIRGRLSFERDQVTIDALEGEMGGGRLQVTGVGRFRKFQPEQVSIHMTAKEVRFRPFQGFSALVDGEFLYEGTSKAQTLGGEIRMRKARYTERIDWKSKLLEIKKREARPRVEASWVRKTLLSLHFVGTEEIWIDNNVAKAPLAVDLQLKGSLGYPVLTGKVSAREGTVYLRNNAFRILGASADFINPQRIDPVFDIHAETRVREYLITLSLTGTVDRLRLSLYSDPSLPDAELLALLAVGRTSKELAGRGTELATGGAATFLTGKLQDALEERVRTIAGFDRFQLDPALSPTKSTKTGGARVTVGKQLLDDRLTVTYSSDISTNEEQIIQMEYRIGRNLSLIAERDELGRLGADFKFRFEFR